MSSPTPAVPNHVMIEDELRVMPETRPDEDARSHKLICRCNVCKRPQAAWHKKQAVRAKTEGRCPEQLASRPERRRPQSAGTAG